MPRPRLMWLFAALVLAFALFAAACGGDDDEGAGGGTATTEEGGEAGGTVVFGSATDPTALDGALISDGESIRVLYQITEGLTRLKAGTATKMILNMLTTGAMIRIGKTWGNLMVDLQATNLKLKDRSERILVESCHVSRDT